MKRLPMFLAVCTVLVVGLGWASHGLQDNLVYYMTPTEVKSRSWAANERIRLGGQVDPGTVDRTGKEVRFVLQDRSSRVPVILVGEVPSTFRAGEEAIVEGVYTTPDGTMHADTVLLKHDERYDQRPAGEP
jgi:cytochrome c-type biogenesis protein CcmE